MDENDGRTIQYCDGDLDITAHMYARDDCTEVRVWTEDGTCLVAVTFGVGDQWVIDSSDVAGFLAGHVLSGGRAGALSFADWVCSTGTVVHDGYYGITGTVETVTDDGEWHGSRQLPTFYVHSRVQGITTREAAVKIAEDILRTVKHTGVFHLHAEPIS